MQNSILCSMRHILSRSSCIALIAMSAASVSTTTAQAQSVTEVEFDGAKTRVNLSGRLRTLNEKVAGSTCRVSADNDNADALQDLQVSSAEYSKIIAALRDGNPAMGIPTPERRARIITSIGEVTEQWDTVQQSINELVGGNDAANNVQVVIDGSGPEALPLSLDKMEAEIVARYTNPNELMAGDAFTISLVARQRKIIQEISKLTCAVATEQTGFGTMEDLKATMDLFDRSLTALEGGMPAVGISPPPSDLISERLTILREHWTDLVDRSLEISSSLDVLEEKAEIYDGLDSEVNDLIALYMLSTPGQADLYSVPLIAYAELEVANWLMNQDLVDAVNAQNAEHASLSQEDIDALDLEWRAEIKSDGGARPLVDETLARPLSLFLKEQKENSGGLINEIIVMDNRGLNVAQNTESSDYWQGDEAKWQETYASETGGVHIGEIEFDDSSNAFQSQVSMPIRDPKTGELIGAITLGVNVQPFL